MREKVELELKVEVEVKFISPNYSSLIKSARMKAKW